jgi:hypothetical protein
MSRQEPEFTEAVKKTAAHNIQLIAKGTIDEEIVAALKSKKNVADIVVDKIGGIIV